MTRFSQYFFLEVSEDFLPYSSFVSNLRVTDKSWTVGGADPDEHRATTLDALDLPSVAAGLNENRVPVGANGEPYRRRLALVAVFANGG